MSRVLNLNNSKNIIADSVFLIQGDDLININDLFLTKDEGSDIVGLAPETLNTLQKIAESIGNDSDFISTINTQLNLKRNIADSYDKTYIDNLISNYYTKSEINSSLALKLDASVINSYYDKTYVDNLISGYYTKTEADTSLNLKANSSDVYTTTQTDNLLALKANQSTTYTKSEVDTSLNLKANQSTTYTKSEVDTALLTKLDLTTYNTEKVLKADIANVYYKSVLYTQTEVNTLLGNKLNSSDISNYYTKTEIDTTFGLYYNKTYIDTLISNYYNKTYIDTTVAGINSDLNLKLNASAIDNYYTKAQVDTQFSNLIDSAPDALNTLKELADALNNDANYATTVENQIATKRNIADSYSITQVDNLLNNKVNSSDFNSLTSKIIIDASLTQILGGSGGVRLQDNLGNNILKVATTGVQTYQHFIGTSAEFTGDVTANNLYSITQVDNLLNNKLDVNNPVANTSLKVNGAFFKIYSDVRADGNIHDGRAITHGVGNKLLINGGGDFNGGVEIWGSCEFLGNVTVPNIYSKTETDALLNNKQNTLVDRGGTGAVFIDLGTDNKVSRIFGANGINVNRYLNLADANDPKNFNIQIDGSTLETAINANTASISSLSSSVSVNSFDITTLDATVSSGLLARYTKTESDNRYYTQSQADTLINAKQDLLNSGNTINLDVGRGLVYLENNSNDTDSFNSSGLTLRAATNPQQGAIFSIRSSGGACRFWTGQSLTSSGINKFGICATGTNSEMNDETKYKHLFKTDGATLTGPVNVNGEITSGDARFYEYDGGTYKVLNIVHDFGINMAVSSNANPATNEILLSMDTTSGVTINTSAYVENNFAVGGAFSAPNIYNKTEVDNLVANAGSTPTAKGFYIYNSADNPLCTNGQSIYWTSLDTIIFNEPASDYTWNSAGYLTINRAMTAKITFEGCAYNQNPYGTLKPQCSFYLRLSQNNGAFVIINGSVTYPYMSAASGNVGNSASCSIMKTFVVGDRIAPVIYCTATNGTTIRAETGRLIVEPLN